MAGARLVSIAVGGVLADAIGVRAVYVFGGLLLLMAGALGLARLRRADLAEAAQSLDGVDSPSHRVALKGEN